MERAFVGRGVECFFSGPVFLHCIGRNPQGPSGSGTEKMDSSMCGYSTCLYGIVPGRSVLELPADALA